MFAFFPMSREEAITTPRERTEPTDRSIPSPPAITTRLWPRATMPRNTDRRRTLMMWPKLRKPGEMTSPKMNSATTAATAMVSLLRPGT